MNSIQRTAIGGERQLGGHWVLRTLTARDWADVRPGCGRGRKKKAPLSAASLSDRAENLVVDGWDDDPTRSGAS